jgi:hypothetical protein
MAYVDNAPFSQKSQSFKQVKNNPKDTALSVPHERREGVFFGQFGIRRCLASAQSDYGLLEHVRIFPPIEPIPKLIQVLKMLYRDLME